MMIKSKSTRTLQILTAVYVALYLAVVLSEFFDGEVSFSDVYGYIVISLFLLFMAGFVLCWKREKTAAIIFMSWNAGAWIYDLLLFRGRDSGSFCIMAVPMLIISALLLLRWYKANRTPVPSEQLQWKFILRVLLVNYAVLYAIVVISELVFGRSHNYFGFPFVIFSVLLPVFIAGFAVSWKNEFMAGIIFIIWSAILLAGSVIYTEIVNSGPWIMFGIPVLMQGLFYLKNHSLYKAKTKL
jgi:hypothetical protein